MSGFIFIKSCVVVSFSVALTFLLNNCKDEPLTDKQSQNIKITTSTLEVLDKHNTANASPDAATKNNHQYKNEAKNDINIKLKKVIANVNLNKNLHAINHPKKYHNNNETIVSFKIQNNLYSDAIKADIPQDVIFNIIKLYRKQLNFNADLRKGNSVCVIYNSSRKLIFSSIKTSKKKYEIFGFQKDKNHYEYYNSSAICLNSDTFLPPVKNARISSRFGLRIHPVKKIKKRHCGIDFAAKIGTPILASESGKLIFIGRKGGYGNCVILKHTNGYKTLYGHMSKFQDKLLKNQTVSKGDVIGYVGKSGIATGPHLHFEIRKNNIPINPEKANYISIESLTSKEIKKFKICKREILSKIEKLSKTY